ncbi:MAG: VWA domain-containing protein [Magnetococcales bacterium]|nr:VWA domain-containing protein [Magnetococcales bacterium]
MAAPRPFGIRSRFFVVVLAALGGLALADAAQSPESPSSSVAPPTPSGITSASALTETAAITPASAFTAASGAVSTPGAPGVAGMPPSTVTMHEAPKPASRAESKPESKAKSMAFEDRAMGVPSREMVRHAPSSMASSPLPPQHLVGGGSMSIAPPAPPPPPRYLPAAPENRDRFPQAKENPVKVTREEPVSTFSVDVDASSYTFVRRLINVGTLPPGDAVRVEEMINYFDYDYAAPESPHPPFLPTVEIFPAPWNSEKQLLLVGIKGYALAARDRPPAHLTLLVDVSGSMSPPDRLPLLRSAFAMMVNQLRPKDTVAVVTYASAVGVALEATPVAEKEKILAAIDALQPGGSTSGGAGIKLAYELAKKSFEPKGINRVILATDGDFNVGVSSVEELKKLIVEQRKSGVYLSVLGVGQNNYNDALMQTLAQNGNGVAAYLDNLNEARRVLVDNLAANLFPIANDVKIQVEFNPEKVAEYRLIGYETRLLNREDFNNDKVDAGEVGAGHTVTALYELTPPGSKSRRVEPLRYALEVKKEDKPPKVVPFATEYAFLKVRYKYPGKNESHLIEQEVDDKKVSDSLKSVPLEHRFAAAVAAFGLKLRGDAALGDFGYDGILDLAQQGKGEDPNGLRAEFINLVRSAKALERK